jgi:hypothetical protein
MTNRDYAILRAVAAFLKGFASRIEQRFQVLELRRLLLDRAEGHEGRASRRGRDFVAHGGESRPGWRQGSGWSCRKGWRAG